VIKSCGVQVCVWGGGERKAVGIVVRDVCGAVREECKCVKGGVVSWGLEGGVGLHHSVIRSCRAACVEVAGRGCRNQSGTGPRKGTPLHRCHVNTGFFLCGDLLLETLPCALQAQGRPKPDSPFCWTDSHKPLPGEPLTITRAGCTLRLLSLQATPDPEPSTPT
jgi:hypothetical protein